jgi:hypothetical protein
MGLDMYIFKVKKTAHSIKELSDLDRNPKPGDVTIAEFEPLDQPYTETMPDHYTIFQEVAYWRKFNALHQWFVSNVQNGIDRCDLHELDQDTLRKCHDVLEEAFYKKNHYILPPTQGFFWGSTEVDDYYWNNVEEAIQTISSLIDNTDWATERLFYQSSW